jgi:hypothetical protein
MTVALRLALALLLVPALARAQEPVEEPPGVIRALRDELAARYRELAGSDLPPDALERALRETLQLRAAQARLVAERWAREAGKRARVGTLGEPKVVLQVRSGAGGGNPNRVDMLGDASPYVRERAEEALPWAPAVDVNEPSRAWAQGGYLPAGKAFVITKVTYRASSAGDPNGHGEAMIHAGGEELFRTRDAAGPFEGTWEGRVVVLPGQESTVWVEVANSSAVEATFEGSFEDLPAEPDAAAPAGPRWDPTRGVSVRSVDGRVVVSQGEVVLWEGEGSSVSSQTRWAGGRQALVIVVDGVEVLRCEAPE